MNPLWGVGASIYNLIELPSEERRVYYKEMGQFVRETGSWLPLLEHGCLIAHCLPRL